MEVMVIIFYISPFDENEIENDLNKKFGRWNFWNNKKKTKARKIVKTSSKLMVRPMLLSYIDYLVDAKEKFNNTYEIYDVLINQWLEREAEKRKTKAKIVKNSKGTYMNFLN